MSDKHLGIKPINSLQSSSLTEEAEIIKFQSIALSYYHKNNFDKSLEYYVKALRGQEFYYKNQINETTANLLYDIGVNYNQLKNYNLSFIYHINALNMRAELYQNQAHQNFAQSLRYVGIAYYFLKDFIQASNYCI